MREVSISQLWSRAWDLCKVNWRLFVRLSILSIIASLFIPFIGALLTVLFPSPPLVRAGYLVALKGQSSFGEASGDQNLLLKVFNYQYILMQIPMFCIVGGYLLVLGIAAAVLYVTHTGGGDEVMSGSEVRLGVAGVILVVVGYILLFIMYLVGWAGPYAILSGRAETSRAIGQSFSLTRQNFGKVFLALLSFMGLVILGTIPFGLGLLVVVPVGYVFLPLLYLALTGEEGVPHS
jgi:hypothetical protein